MSHGFASLLATLLLAGPAGAALKTYTLSGDQSTLFPTCGTILRPGAVSGSATLDDSGDGAPVLVDLEVVVDFTMLAGGDSSSIPGTTVFLASHAELGPAPLQAGAGGTTSSIEWGPLNGWTQTGYIVCLTNYPGDPGPQLPPDPSSCELFVGFEGTGPPAPLSSNVFDSDPWTFSGDGFSFQASPIEYVDLGEGAVTADVVWRGDLSLPIPALPLAGLAGLGAALVYLGARALRRPSR